MNPVVAVGAVAAASGVCMALSPLLQVQRIRKLGDASEVSAGVYMMMRVNATIWLAYGVLTANAVIVIPNVAALATTTATLLTIKRYRRRAAAPTAPAVSAQPTVVAPLPLDRRPAARVRRGERRHAVARGR